MTSKSDYYTAYSAIALAILDQLVSKGTIDAKKTDHLFNYWKRFASGIIVSRKGLAYLTTFR